MDQYQQDCFPWGQLPYGIELGVDAGSHHAGWESQWQWSRAQPFEGIENITFPGTTVTEPPLGMTADYGPGSDVHLNAAELPSWSNPTGDGDEYRDPSQNGSGDFNSYMSTMETFSDSGHSGLIDVSFSETSSFRSYPSTPTASASGSEWDGFNESHLGIWNEFWATRGPEPENDALDVESGHSDTALSGLLADDEGFSGLNQPVEVEVEIHDPWVTASSPDYKPLNENQVIDLSHDSQVPAASVLSSSDLRPLSDGEVAMAFGPATALSGWDWSDSGTVWLDLGVSSRVAICNPPYRVTTKCKVERIEEVTGCPSQIPIPEIPTAFLLDFGSLKDQNKTPDAIFKSLDCHSWDGNTGGRTRIDARLPGPLFGRPSEEKIACRRVDATCKGILGCESLGDYLHVRQRGLDPAARDLLVAAELRTRELQDDSAVGRVLAFVKSLARYVCRATLQDGSPCGGHAIMEKLTKAFRGKDYLIVCSKRNIPTAEGRHTSHALLDHIDQEMLFKVMNGQQIVEAPDTGVCPRIVPARVGLRGRSKCPFNHIRDGVPFEADITPIVCSTKIVMFCPSETLHPDIALRAVFVPSSDQPHSHPPPPADKLNIVVANLYKQCARAYGPNPTPLKVDKAPTTVAILGTIPSLYHPGLANRDVRARLCREVRDETGGSPTTGPVAEQIALYLARQQTLPVAERFIHSSIMRDGKTIMFGINSKLIKNIRHVRALDCDTTFKPVAGDMQIYEINGWIPAVNKVVTLGRVWMQIHDRAIYRQVWEELLRLITQLTERPLRFVGIHQNGTLLGMTADMEAAPLLGFGDALAPSIDRAELADLPRDAETVLSTTVRICYTHLDRGTPECSDLCRDCNNRIKQFRYLQSVEEVEDFVIWLRAIPDTRLQKWWDHKEQHKWLLPGTIQCLSRIPLERWNQIPSSTNMGEGKHATNNAETGTQMSIIQSFKTYAEFDARCAEEIENMFATGSLNNVHNEVVDRYANSNRRRVAANDKKAEVNAYSASVRSMEEEQKELRARGKELKEKLKQMRAEEKSNSSGRVRVSRRRGKKSKIAEATLEAENVSSASGEESTGEGKTAEPNDTPNLAESSQQNSATTSDTSKAIAPRKKRKTRAAAPTTSSAPKSKRARKATDPLSTWHVQSVDGGPSMTAREFATKFPDEFRADFPGQVQYI